LPSNDHVSRIQVDDLDSDGFVDVIVSASYTSKVHYQLPGSGTGASVFEAPVSLAYTAIAIGDFDGDGDRDLASGDYESGEVEVFEQVAPRVFVSVAELYLNASDDPGAHDIFWARVDDDPLPDIVVRVSNYQSLEGFGVFKQVTKGRFAPDAHTPREHLTLWTGTGASAMVDMDGDGEEDLVTTTDDDVILLFGGH
jgi:hypothetical protein